MNVKCICIYIYNLYIIIINNVFKYEQSQNINYEIRYYKIILFNM